MSIGQRKLDHLHHVLNDRQVDRQGGYFDAFRLMHHALPEIDLADVDIRCEFLGKPLQAPLLISSMTGGDHADIITINQRLAEAAEHCGVALSVGSQRIQFERPNAVHSFALRPLAPSIPLIANLGAVQLNYQLDVTHAQAAIEQLEADGLYLHLNPLQEAIQPEGDTNFAGLWHKIFLLQSHLSQPILLKEVGSGLSPELIRLGMKQGIQYFDVAGSGGTSWSRIEQLRSSGNTLGLTFQDWGLPTPWILQQCRPFAAQTQLIASGGLRNGIDVVKSIVLGARIAGMAAPFLQPAMESTQAVIDRIEQIKQEIRITLFLLGKINLKQLWLNDNLMIDCAEGKRL
jgi:isopentenyl-diphosphate delta-isomerase